MADQTLEPLFPTDWVGGTWPTHEFTDAAGWRVEVYECNRCGALTTKPGKHWAWHGKVDTNTTAEV